MEDRACLLGKYIAETGSTVRRAAQVFAISKSTVHKDVTVKLRREDRALYARVREVLEKNKAERHIRGGLATREKFLHREETPLSRPGGEPGLGRGDMGMAGTRGAEPFVPAEGAAGHVPTLGAAEEGVGGGGLRRFRQRRLRRRARRPQRQHRPGRPPLSSGRRRRRTGWRRWCIHRPPE